MALFGGGRRSGGLLVDGRSEEEQRRQIEAIMGRIGNPGPGLVPPQMGGNAVARQFEPQLPDFRVTGAPNLPTPQPVGEPAPQRTIDPEVLKLVGEAPKKKKKDNTLRDILAFTLAAVGDTAAARSGYRGNALNGVFKSWEDRRDTFNTQRQMYEDRMRMAGLPGMNAREMAAYLADPKAWGGHMADAATSRFQAATLNPGDTRFLGQGNGSLQAPTRGQQYAESLGLTEGSDPYSVAIRDQEMGANGPTAFGNSQMMEKLRAGNRANLEATRQRNRLGVRGAPTYRDINPGPPRPPAARSAPRRTARPTATGPNGEKVEWNGKAWVPAQ